MVGDLFGSFGTDTFAGNVGADNLSGGNTFDWLAPVASAAVEGFGTFLANKATNKGATQSAQQFAQDNQAVADILKSGYNEQIGYTEQAAQELSRMLGISYNEARSIIQQAGVDYGDTLSQGVTSYADLMYPQQRAYGDALTSAEGAYGTALGQTEGQAGQYLKDASQQYQDFYDPFVQAGDEALGYTRQQAAIDPSMLTPSQQRVRDEFDRNMMATLAASGLRGAGRAGVAMVNDGRAALSAQLYDQNQRRKDDAMRSLLEKGYSATGNAASNIQGLGNSLADMRFKVGSETASGAKSTAQDVAKTQYGVTDKIGSQILSNADKVATNNQSTSKDVANLSGQYYGNLGNLTTSLYGAYGDTAVAKAAADAAAYSNSASNNAAVNNANSSRTGNTIGTITSIIGNGVKESMAPWMTKKTQVNANA